MVSFISVDDSHFPQYLTRTVRIDPDYIKGLDTGENLGYRDILYHPKYFFPGDHSSNDNSTVKLFRKGCFNVASTGDIEHENLGSLLRRDKIFNTETDILMLPHHGASTDVVTKKFLDEVKPTIAVSNSNFANQYDHPTQALRNLLSQQKIDLYTTKAGDVVVESIGGHTQYYQVTDYISSGETVKDVQIYPIRKHEILSRNADSIRNHYKPGYGGKA